LKSSNNSKAGTVTRQLADLPPAVVRFVEPMKCQLRATLPEGDEWVYEVKFDGFRGLALKQGSTAELLSRNNKDLGGRFPGVVRALEKLPHSEFVLDGEVVALDREGRSSFQLLQRIGDPAANRIALCYYIFDILSLNGKDTTTLPLMKRKALLKTVLADGPDCLRTSDVLEGSGGVISRSMREHGLEGLIAKRRDSIYEIGKRSGAWVKFKWGFEQEFVIGGYTDPEGSRPYFGSVLVGYYEGERLIFAAKVGTGFDTKRLKSLYDHFQKIRIDKAPFANLPERGGVVTASQMRFCKWVKPELICQVRFTEWTSDHHLRQPVFLGLREDKQPHEVVREV
jgi:bifunctional non-homologous end joining protein LigD